MNIPILCLFGVVLPSILLIKNDSGNYYQQLIHVFLCSQQLSHTIHIHRICNLANILRIPRKEGKLSPTPKHCP